jgi:hypothetical protein
MREIEGKKFHTQRPQKTQRLWGADSKSSAHCLRETVLVQVGDFFVEVV